VRPMNVNYIFSDVERAVLRALKDPEVRGTVDDLRAATGLPGPGVATTLRRLEQRNPPFVASAVDEKLGTRVWTATLAAADALDASGG